MQLMSIIVIISISYSNDGCFETLAEFKRRVVRDATEYEEKHARKVREARKHWLPPDMSHKCQF